MKAYEFKESEIMEIAVERVFDSLQDMKKGKNVSRSKIQIELDMENFNKYMSTNEILSEEIDSISFLQDVERIMPEHFLYDHTLNLSIEKKVDGTEINTEDVINALNLLNESMQIKLDEELGSELEHYINKKEEEAHDEVTFDFANDIRKRVVKRLREERPRDFFILIHNTETLSTFDMNQQSENKDYLFNNEDFGLPHLPPSSKKREEMVRLLENSEFVVDFGFSGTHNDRLKIEANHEAKKILKQVCIEETKKYYEEKSQPNYEQEKAENFIQKNSNQKGSIMDVYYNEETNKVIIIEQTGKKEINKNEETEDKSLNAAIEVVNKHIKEKEKLEKINKIKPNRRRMR